MSWKEEWALDNKTSVCVCESRQTLQYIQQNCLTESICWYSQKSTKHTLSLSLSLSNEEVRKDKHERKYNELSIELIPYKSIELWDCFLHDAIKLEIRHQNVAKKCCKKNHRIQSMVEFRGRKTEKKIQKLLINH